MSAADGGHRQTCQSLVLEDFRPSSPQRLTGRVKPQQIPPSSKKISYLHVSLHHKYFLITLNAAHQCHCPLRDCHFPAEEQELFYQGRACYGLGQNIILEMGKSAIGRLLLLWNVTCTPKTTAKLRKLLWIFNICGWSWPQLCIS